MRLLVEKAPTALTLQPIIMSLVGIDFWRRQITHSNAGREQCFVSAPLLQHGAEAFAFCLPLGSFSSTHAACSTSARSRPCGLLLLSCHSLLLNVHWLPLLTSFRTGSLVLRQAICRELAAADPAWNELHTVLCKLGRLFNRWRCAADRAGTTGWQLLYARVLGNTSTATVSSASALRVAVSILVATATTVRILRGVRILGT